MIALILEILKDCSANCSSYFNKKSCSLPRPTFHKSKPQEAYPQHPLAANVTTEVNVPEEVKLFRSVLSGVMGPPQGTLSSFDPDLDDAEAKCTQPHECLHTNTQLRCQVATLLASIDVNTTRGNTRIYTGSSEEQSERRKMQYVTCRESGNASQCKNEGEC